MRFYNLADTENVAICKKCNLAIFYEDSVKRDVIVEKILFKDSDDYAMNFYIKCPKCNEKIKTGGFVTRYG